jgi:acetyl esterase/lipase
MPSENDSASDTRSARIYRSMTRAELNQAYDNRAAVADSAAIIAGWARDSIPVRQRPGARLDIAYGPTPRNVLDYSPCGAPQPPLLIFIHGGYWLRNDKDMFAFAAQGRWPPVSMSPSSVTRWPPRRR